MQLPQKRKAEDEVENDAKRQNVGTKEDTGDKGDPRTWNPQQVHDWIRSMTSKSAEIFANEFLENDINGSDMLDLERDDFFQQFNHVTNAFAKKKLWKQIQELRPAGAKKR
eukprot:UN26763